MIQEAKVDGVDMEHPPNSKIFDTTHRNSADISALSKRRLALQTQSTNSPSISLNFEGLADVLKIAGLNGNPTALPAPIGPQTLQSQSRTPDYKAPKPKISLVDFCLRYDLSHDVQLKLTTIKVTGPHALRYIDDATLREEGQLELGELADIRDAQERWQMEL